MTFGSSTTSISRPAEPEVPWWFCLPMQLIALATSVAALMSWHVDGGVGVRLAILLALALGYSEASRRIERLRRYLAPGGHVPVTPVWLITGVLALPVSQLPVVVLCLVSYEALRGGRAARPQLPLNASRWTLTSVAAGLTYRALAGGNLTTYGAHRALAVVIALAVFVVMDLVLLDLATRAGGIRQHAPRRVTGLQVSGIALGALSAQLLIATPLLAPLIGVLVVLMQRSALVSQLEVAATTDAKTGLLNAAAWQDLAQRELLRARRESAPGAVMLLDLDHFKRLNDTLGHLRGDIALKAVADALRRELRGYDAVARFGGEEFVVFLNGLPLPDAAVVAERILVRIRNLKIAGTEPDAKPYHLTASIGLASYPEQGQELVQLLEAADLALYGAKHSGRDRVGQLWVAGPGERAGAIEARQSTGLRDLDSTAAREAS